MPVVGCPGQGLRPVRDRRPRVRMFSAVVTAQLARRGRPTYSGITYRMPAHLDTSGALPVAKPFTAKSFQEPGTLFSLCSPRSVRLDARTGDAPGIVPA